MLTCGFSNISVRFVEEMVHVMSPSAKKLREPGPDTIPDPTK